MFSAPTIYSSVCNNDFWSGFIWNQEEEEKSWEIEKIKNIHWNDENKNLITLYKDENIYDVIYS